MKTKKKPLGDVEVTYISDYDPTIGLMDTTVEINGQIICVIEGAMIEEFHDKLAQIINDYRI